MLSALGMGAVGIGALIMSETGGWCLWCSGPAPDAYAFEFGAGAVVCHLCWVVVPVVSEAARAAVLRALRERGKMAEDYIRDMGLDMGLDTGLVARLYKRCFPGRDPMKGWTHDGS